MTLMEHLYELRDRLFKAVLGIIAGMIVGYILSEPILDFLQSPYCDVTRQIAIDKGETPRPCAFVQLGAADYLLLQLKVAMWAGLVIAAPIWLYQLWAFVAPGLHRHEQRWAYMFAGIAAPLFALGTGLAYFVVKFGLEFLLSLPGNEISTSLEISRYIEFVTGLMLLFGVAFEFPLAVLLLNFAGVFSARRLLGWWRIVVFLFFAFSAVATPTPDPFGMTALAIALSGLYFAAVGVAFLNDRRRARNRESFDNLSDDEISPLDYDRTPVNELDPVEGPTPVEAPAPVGAPEPVAAPRPLDHRWDDMT